MNFLMFILHKMFVSADCIFMIYSKQSVVKFRLVWGQWGFVDART